MKTKLQWFLSALLFAAALSLSGCDKDDASDPDNKVPDPEGTVTVKIRNDKNSFVGSARMNAQNNFLSGGENLVDLGAMKGLGNIVKIPESGWAYEVAVQPGHGYLHKTMESKDTVYYRIYVVDFLTNTSDGIIGAEVKYQKFLVKSPEPTKLELSKENFEFSIKGTTENLVISTNVKNWTYFCKDTSWFKIRQDQNNIQIIVPDNNTITKRETTIEIRADEITKTVTLNQAAVEKTSAPYMIGDLYYENGVIGVVYKVTNNGSHGMIASLKQMSCKWNTNNSPAYLCTDESNGLNNLDIIKAQAHWETRYPAFKWCEDLNTNGNTGWYMPSINELKDLYAGYCGLSSYPGSENDASSIYAKARRNFNKTRAENGGDEISYYYPTFYSSTQYQDTNPNYFKVQCLSMDRGHSPIAFVYEYCGVIAVKAF